MDARYDFPTYFSEFLDLGEAVNDDFRMVVLKVLGELGDVVHLDLVPQTRLFLKTWT